MDFALKKWLFQAKNYFAVIVLIWVLFLELTPFDSFHAQLGIGYGILFSYLSILVAQRFHWLLGASFFYFSIITLSRIVYPTYYWKEFELPAIVGFESLVAEAQIYLTILTIFFLSLDSKKIRSLIRLFRLFCIVDVIVMIFKLVLGQDPWFLFNNPAIDISFISCCIPLFLTINHKSKWAILIPILFLCFLTKTSSGVLGAGLGFGLYFICKKKFGLIPISLSALFAGIAASIGLWMQKSETLLNSSGRFGIWKMAMSWWLKEANHIIGTGMGTYHMIGLALQIDQSIAAGIKTETIPGFFWMHNDWLQVLFETGPIGLMFSVAVFALAIWKSRQRPAVFAGLITFGALAIIQMPARHLLFSFLGLFFIVMAFEKSENSGSESSGDN